MNDQEKIEKYLHKLIDFASDAIEELNFISNLNEKNKANFIEIAEKFGEKKTSKVKEILDPLNNFLKFFV
jgi:hypothetical protein